jgi:hydrogenase maturation protease
MSRVVVIGVGNQLRGDDAAGLEVLRRLAEGTLAEGVELRACSGEPASLLAAWSGADALFLVDAGEAGDPPGTVRRYDASAASLPTEGLRHSTHALGPAEAIELSRALGTLPPSVVVFTIEGQGYGQGEGLVPEVAAGVEEAAARLAEELPRSGCGGDLP